MPGVEGGQYVVAEILDRPFRMDQRSAQGVEALVERVVAGLDEPVRVEGEEEPSFSSISTSSKGSPPTPSGMPGGTSSSRAASPGSATAGGRWPALAKVHRRVTGS